MNDNRFLINMLSSRIAGKGYLNSEFILNLKENISQKHYKWISEELLYDLEDEEISYVQNNNQILEECLKNAVNTIEKGRRLVTAKKLYFVNNIVFYRNEIEVFDSIKGKVLIHAAEDLY